MTDDPGGEASAGDAAGAGTRTSDSAAPSDASTQQAVDAFARRVDYPLMVVTTGNHDGERSGCLAGFITKCSIEPPRFLVCISKLNHTLFVAERSDSLVLHLLGESQLELASLFGEQTGDLIDKFERCRWHVGGNGVPVLDECAAWIEGRIMASFPVGDHQAFLMRPVGGGRGRQAGVLTLQHSPAFEAGHPTS
jgi:flavin reductase (DIM6/NTAB) family NADH-FMN oxidoreductase RutF